MIRWFTKHQTAANLLMVVLILMGIMAMPDLSRETFPEIENDKVEVRVPYKGATSEEVEDAICRRLEDSLEGVVNLEEIRCEAREGQGVLTAIKLEGASMARFLDDVKSEVDAIDDFPEATEQPIVEELGRTAKVISVAITGPEDPVRLKAYAEVLKTRIQSLSNVAEVVINGFSEHQLRVEVPAVRLRQFKLSVADIASAIERQNISMPNGQLEGAHENVLLRFDDQGKTVEALSRIIVISGQTGAAIRLGDIATITDRFEKDEDKILFDGKRAAVLDVSKTKSQDILDVFDDVKRLVDLEQEKAPEGVALTLTQDVSTAVRDRLDMLVSNGVQGVVLVFLVLWLFFSLRYSFWVTMGLPVSFLGALYVLLMMDVTINMISMVGLLIGIGLLMDDAIVIAENIAARMNKGDKPMQAAINGVQQVAPGIASSFATTLMVFGSLAFISGEIGQILRVMPVVLIVVVSVSLLEAFFVLPNHLGHSLAHMHSGETSKFRAAFDRRFDHFRETIFGPLLDKAVDYRYLTIGIVIMLLIISVAIPAGGKLKFVGFPATEGDIVEARILLPQGTPLARTEMVVSQVTAALEKVNASYRPRQPDQQDLIKHVTVIYNQNPDAYETGPHVARVIADLLSAEVRDAPLQGFRQAWRDEVGQLTDVISINYTEPNVGPGGRSIDVRLLGGELSMLKLASADLQQWFSGYAGVIDLADDTRPGKRELRLHLKESAGALGVDGKMVADQVRAAFQGSKIDEFPVGAETYEIDLRLIADDRSSGNSLDDFNIVGNNDALIPLTVVADVEEARGWARINRVNGERAISVQGDVQSDIANAQELLTLAGQTIFPELQEKYPGLQIEIQGQSKESAETGKSIILNILLGMLGIYMLLALQFRGYLAPITVMSVIPTALIGMIFGHLLMGLDLTMPSIIGMASLFGVVVNDSILLVVFIRDARAEGIPVAIAAKQAGRARFRPILLTSVTTVAGLMPLLAETSLQAQILIPLATSLAFGLTTATLMALFLVPAIYCVLDDFNVLGAIHEEKEV